MTDKNKNQTERNSGETLTVAEAIQMDVGRGVVRMSSEYLSRLGISSGDIVVIKGVSECPAIVWRARAEDEGLDIIRMDGLVRYNAGVSLGDKVVVRKAEVKEAKKIILSPLEEVSFTSDPTHFFHEKLLSRALKKDMKIAIDVLGTTLYYLVTLSSPKGIVKVTPETELVISENVVKEEQLKGPNVNYEDIGGLKQEIEQIREMIELPMKHPEVFERLGVGVPKGLLLTGPPGTGKTLLAKAVASETESAFYSIAGPEIMSKFYGESEKQLRDIFEEAEKNAPSIIFIDEIDAISPKREETHGEVEKRVVAQLLTLMDGLKSRGNVVVIGATNIPDSIDPALRRPGRFDREIRIGTPTREARKEILQIHTRGMPLGEDVDLDRLAELTVGYTGADLNILCKEAALKSLKTFIPSLSKYDERVPTNVLEKIVVRMEHFLEALRKIEPSAMREIMITKPNVKWDDIGGLKGVKEQLKEAIIWPLTDPKLFKEAGIKPPKGILLYGPPGCGKTLIAKAIANEANANFISVKGPELISKWVGESEKHIRDVFKRARQLAPSVIFFDEFDSISKVRGMSLTDSTERVVNQLLTELDGIESLDNVMVIAATNRPELIDSGLLRAGRIDTKVEIPLPDAESRKEIFTIHTRKMPLSRDFDLEKLTALTENMSGADIAAICREAGMSAVRDVKEGRMKKPQVSMGHFERAVEKVKDMSEIKKDSSH